MDSFEQPTSEQLNELLRMLDEGRNLGFETFRGKLLKRARECDWRWLPPTKPQQWFNRTALNIYTS